MSDALLERPADSPPRHDDQADPWRTVLLVHGPEGAYTGGYKNGATDEEFLASVDALLGRPRDE